MSGSKAGWRRVCVGGASVLALLIAGAPAADVQAQTSATRAAPGLPRTEGYIPFYWDAARGRVLIEIPAFDTDVLYYVSAASGGGSVELPMDRGILSSKVIQFQRVGPKVLVVEQNTDYRAVNGTPARAANVAASFPTSLLAALPVESEAGGRVVVDATALFMRDAAGVEAQLQRAGQGAFRFDAGRSTYHPARMKAFPLNTEIETLVTFSADNPGPLVRNVTPDPRHVTVRIHHSFLKAPEGYVPREADPRIGVSTLRFQDFSLPISERPKEAWITRWRLEKKDPSAEISEPKTPIVFYFDPAIPDPLRQAMKEGALWWNAAFEQAGFRNAVQAVDAPPDMDPMDIRYAYVLWIERDERGFSSGGTYRDPRTGEILGAKTRMDSHRIRTVANYFDAYSGALPADGTGVTIADPGLLTPEGLDGMPPAQRDMVLVRQALLTAHELGHVLGFGHNFASSLNDRASVMEYPTPRVAVRNGRLDISEAFQKAIGAYDTAMVRYAYSVFPDEAERDGLNGVIADMRADGLIYVPPTDPRWTWYDDRASPTEYLRETLAARALMLDGFGQEMLSPGEPVGALRDMRLWMAYLHHRWAIERGQGYVGGLYQNIVLKGDNVPPTEFVPGALQREVLALLMEGLRPEQLSIPEALLAQLTPDPNPNLEDLSTDAVFDQVKAARVLSAMILEPLFDKQKAARLVALGARQPDALTFPEMVQAVMSATWNAWGDATPQARALRRAAQAAALDSMMILGAQADASPEARAYVLDELAKLSASLKTRRESDPLSLAFQRQSARDIDRYLEDPAAHAPKSAMPAWGATPRSRFPMPPGPPLGG